MPNHPNRNWRSRWVVNLAARTATHRDGWVFKFALGPDEDGGIDGKCIAQPSLVAYDKNKLQATLARIAREAGEIYQESLND